MSCQLLASRAFAGALSQVGLADHGRARGDGKSLRILCTRCGQTLLLARAAGGEALQPCIEALQPCKYILMYIYTHIAAFTRMVAAAKPASSERERHLVDDSAGAALRGLVSEPVTASVQTTLLSVSLSVIGLLLSPPPSPTGPSRRSPWALNVALNVA